MRALIYYMLTVDVEVDDGLSDTAAPAAALGLANKYIDTLSLDRLRDELHSPDVTFPEGDDFCDGCGLDKGTQRGCQCHEPDD